MRNAPTDCGATTGTIAAAGAAVARRLEGRGADGAVRLLVARFARQLGQVGRHLEPGRAGGRGRAVVDLVAGEEVLDRRAAADEGEARQHGRDTGRRGKGHSGGLHRSAADGRESGGGAARNWLRPRAFALSGRGSPRSREAGFAQRRVDRGLAGLAERRDRQPHRRAAAAEPLQRPLGRRRARLDEERLVQAQQLQLQARASRALPASAAAQSACIARGATLAVTLTLPWPPSSISATAVPSSPE